MPRLKMADLGGLPILSALWKRQAVTSCQINAHIGCKILRNVILQPRSKFTPVWSKECKNHLCVGLDRRIYLDNHHRCYYNEGFEGKPGLKYELDKSIFKKDRLHKILGVLLYHCHNIRSPTSLEEREVCLMVLTADGFLKILNGHSGEILRSVFLSTAIKFKYLSWADYLKTVQVKTVVLEPRRPALPGRGVVNSRYLVIAIFKIHPLELSACLDIEKKIFGEDIVDASVNEDLLVVTHRDGTVKMYSLTWIIENCSVVDASLGRFVELPSGEGLGIRGGSVGNPGFGIPSTVKLAECPPLLFSAKTSNQIGVSFGGLPTVYLHGHSSKANVFSLSSLQKQQLITELKSEVMAFHSDVVEFHFDDQRRVIHISGCTLSCYRLQYDDKGQRHKLHRQYKTDFRHLLAYTNQPECTSSGRVIKRRHVDTTDLYTSAVQDVDYENETDLLYAVVTLPDRSSEDNLQCNLYFINEKNGSVLKTVPLPTWEPDGNNSIYYELDCILHILQRPSSSVCYYYRLC